MLIVVGIIIVFSNWSYINVKTMVPVIFISQFSNKIHVNRVDYGNREEAVSVIGQFLPTCKIAKA